MSAWASKATRLKTTSLKSLNALSALSALNTLNGARPVATVR